MMKINMLRRIFVMMSLMAVSVICGMTQLIAWPNISSPAVASDEIFLRDCTQPIKVPLNQAAIQKIQYCTVNRIPFWLGIKENSPQEHSTDQIRFSLRPVPLYINGRMVSDGGNNQFHLFNNSGLYEYQNLSEIKIGSYYTRYRMDGGIYFQIIASEIKRSFHLYDFTFNKYTYVHNAHVIVDMIQRTGAVPQPDDDISFHFVVVPGDYTSYEQIETGDSPIHLHWYGFWTYVPLREYLFNSLDTVMANRGKYHSIYSPWDKSRPTAADPVDLATGEETHSSKPDLVVPNPNGPGVSFSRTYSSALAKLDYGSPGLPKGWTNNLNYRIEVPAQDWGSLVLSHPNGYSQEIIPQLDGDGNPTNPTNFKLEDGTPYVIKGVPNTTTVGLWDSISMTSEDQMTMTFTKPAGCDSYQVDRITNRFGRSIRFTGRTSAYNFAPSQIEDVTSGKILLKFNYNVNGLLSELIEYSVGKPFRKVGYKYGVSLSKVSKIKSADAQFTAADWASPRWEYTYTPYDQKQLLTTVSQPSPIGTGISTLTFTIDSEGRVTSQKDSQGTRIVFNYSDSSTDVKILDSSNQQIRRYTQKIDVYGRNAGVLEMDNTQASIKYENDIFYDKPTSIVDSDGKSVSLVYNNDGKVIEASGPYGSAINSYDGVGQLSKLLTTKKNGITQTAYTYTSEYDLIKTVSVLRPGATIESLVTTTYTYDFEKGGPAYGRVVEVEEPASAATGTRKTTRSYRYDKDPDYDVNGYKPGPYKPAAQTMLPLTVTDQNNRTTHYRYDSRGNITVIIDTDGRRTEMTYNIADQVVLTKGPVDPVTQKQQIVYNMYAYPGGFAQKSLVFSNGSEYYKFANGIPGFKVAHIVENKYDSEGKLVKSLLDDKLQVERVYDSLGRLKELKDCRGATPRTTTFSFDAVGHLTDVVGPANQTVHNTAWDPNGRVITSIDGRGIRSTYNYDPAGKKELLSIDYFDTNNPAANIPSVSYTYYPDGQVHTVSDYTGTRTYSYGLDGSTISVATAYTQPTGNVTATVNYSYNPDGSLASNQIVTATKTLDYNYTYDKDGRLINLKNPDGKQSSWEFNSDRSLKCQRLGNHAETWYYYDSFDRLSKQESKDPNGNLLTRYSGFTYNDPDSGGLTGYNTNIWGKPAFNGNRSFAYDNQQRLQSESWVPQAGGQTTTNAYSFDDQYNILTSSHEITGFTGTDYKRHYNNDYQWDGYALAADQTNSLLPSSQSLFQYDSNGNPTKYKDASSELKYDAQNNLVSYKIGTNTLITAGYRSDGLRAWKENTAGRIYYIYSGTTLLCEIDSTNALSSYNTWGPTGLLSRTVTAGSKETWYIFDPQGDVALRLNGNGIQQSTDRYDAFGNLLAGGDTTDPYGYKGQEGYYTDHETGLILCTYRYYDPLAGRWLTADPIGSAGGMNLYAYCSGDPVNASDPQGLCEEGFWDHFSWKAGVASLGGSALAVACVAFPPAGVVVASVGGAIATGALIYNTVKRKGNFVAALDDTFLKPLEDPFNFGFAFGAMATGPVAAITEGVPGALMPGGMWRGPQTIDPNKIRFSQKSVNDAAEIIESMEQSGWKGDPIDMVKMPDGKLTTVDNSRLLAAKNTGTGVKGNIHDFDELLSPAQVIRFTRDGVAPNTWGEAILLRIANQSSRLFRELYPYGSNITGWDGN